MWNIRWKLSALNELAAVWTQADATGRGLITQATHAIDMRLSQDPYASSESRYGQVRIDYVLPLSVVFEADRNSRTVTVLHVNYVRPRKK
jgi:hypothetical protein